MSNTIRFHRVLAAPPEKIFRAFTEPDAFARWLPPNGFTAKVHSMDAKVGGTYRMSFTNFTTGNGHSFGGEFRELDPAGKISYTSVFEDPHMEGEMLTSVVLKAVSCGTEMEITQSGIPAFIPPEQCVMGWQQSLLHLATLVEPDIPD